MLYLKSYCYSQHELPFIIANLDEGFNYIDKYYLYEYNARHTGRHKDYEIAKVLHLIPEHLREKLVYKMVDVESYMEDCYENEQRIHDMVEPIQRSWFYNDEDVKLEDEDIIIDIDCDEIIYRDSYSKMLEELNKKNYPLGIRLNQFFYKQNYIWINCNFSSPTIYKYQMVKNSGKVIKGLKIMNLRDIGDKTDKIYGCHCSWIMPASYMVNKLHSYSHPCYRKYADEKVLQKAIDDKVYIFDLNRKFDIVELPINHQLIPKSLQKEELFDYLTE
jgi:hypothetical protein